MVRGAHHLPETSYTCVVPDQCCTRLRRAQPYPPPSPCYLIPLGPFLALLIREDFILVSVLYLQEKGHSRPRQSLLLPSACPTALLGAFWPSSLEPLGPSSASYTGWSSLPSLSQLLALQPEHHGVKQPAWPQSGLSRVKE